MKKKLCHSLCFLLLFSILFSHASRLFIPKEEMQHFSRFWEGGKEYNVLFLGTSHVYAGISVMDLWKDYGITSYNLGASKSYMPQTYWTMRCAFQYCTPSVVVIDTYHIQQSEKFSTEETALIHSGFDSIPFSPEKIRAVFDLFSTKEDRIEYLFPFYIYHNRWEELNSLDFEFAPDALNGSRMNSTVEDHSNYRLIPESDAARADTIGYEYLEKCITECKQRGIEVVLTGIPFCSKKSQRGVNGVASIAEKYHVPFLNIPYQDNPVDNAFDFRDNGHLNIYGMKKITHYIGEYLSKNYNFDQVSAKEAARWNQQYETYLAYRKEQMNLEETLERYLPWLSEEYYHCQIFVNREKEVPERIQKQLDLIPNQQIMSEDWVLEEFPSDDTTIDFAFAVYDENGNLISKTSFVEGILHKIPE